MTWKTVRLELARTSDFPEGSTAHAYILRVPLDARDLVDPEHLHDVGERAAVHRFRPDEPDATGAVIRVGDGWALSYRLGDADDEAIFHLENHPIIEGHYLTITEADGERRPFKVVSCRP